MTEPDTPIEVTPVEARGGQTPGIVRYVLAISLGLTVLLFGIIYLVAYR